MLDTEKSGSNPSIKETSSPTVRKPPIEWATYRHRIVRAAEQTRPPSLEDEHSIDSNVSK